MGTTETESPVAAQSRRQREKGKYVVLREITSLDELTAMLEGGETQVFAVVRVGVEGRSTDQAIRATAIEGDEAKTGTYVATPLSSFRPVAVKQVIQLVSTDE
jgi:hypothetical protein